MENNSQDFDSPRRSMQQSPTKLQQNKSEMMNSQLSPDKDKRPEKTKNEAKIALKNDTDLARKLLLEGEIQKSLDLSFKTIVDHKEALGGENSIFLLPGYFVLAEAFIHEGKIKKAVEFLLAASWNFLKFQNKNEEKKNDTKEGKMNESIAKIDEEVTEDEYIYYKSWLHKTFSKLYNAENNTVKALDELKIAIYLDCKKYGAEDIRTSFNYYHMGTIFLKKRCTSEAEAFFGKVSEIWYRFLKKIHLGNKNINKLNDDLDELLIKEALYILKLIEEYFNKNLIISNNIQFSYCSKNLYALALLHLLIREDFMFGKYFEKLVQGNQEKFGEDHKKTKKTKERLDLFLQEQEK